MPSFLDINASPAHLRTKNWETTKGKSFPRGHWALRTAESASSLLTCPGTQKSKAITCTAPLDQNDNQKVRRSIQFWATGFSLASNFGGPFQKQTSSKPHGFLSMTPGKKEEEGKKRKKKGADLGCVSNKKWHTKSTMDFARLPFKP